jgi:hypothetical protein
MTTLEEASREIADVITSHIEALETRYTSLEHHGGSLRCNLANGDFIELKALPDHERRRIEPPRTGSEYQAQGGHKALAARFAAHNPDAWSIKLTKRISGSLYEVAFDGNEGNWSSSKFNEAFIATFLS